MALDPSALGLEGRAVLVTGAAAGLGRATAESLARFGADLLLCDRDAGGLEAVCAEIRGAGGAVASRALDVRDAAAVTAWVESIGEGTPALHGLVNNAGGTFDAPFAGLSPNAQQALVDENFTSVTSLVRACLPLLAAEGGSIVNVTSVEAHRAAPGFAVYAAMKAAVASLTQSLALELGDRSIRVNCVAPDAIPTPGTGDFDLPTPLPTTGRADDAAGAVLFLLSDLARFVTGTTLHVDGGTHAAGGWRRDSNGRFTLF